MPVAAEKIGEVVRQGLLLFSKGIPIPAVSLVSAIAAAVITKSIEVHRKRVSDALSFQLELQHISYVQPDRIKLLAFFKKNPIYPELAAEFDKEIKTKNWKELNRLYPYLYSALVLENQIPLLLFHKELENGEFRKMALAYEKLAKGFTELNEKPQVRTKVNRFGAQLLEVLSEAYGAARKEMPRKNETIALEVIDLIRELASS